MSSGTASRGAQWSAAWGDLRSRRRWFFGWWMGGLPAVVVASMLVAIIVGGTRGERWAERFSSLAGILWFLGCFPLAWRLFFDFRCPRCGQRFYLRGLVRNPFTTRCRHCGLRQGSQPESA